MAGPYPGPEAFLNVVRVVLVPEPAAHHHLVGAEQLAGDSRFWVYTEGMALFDRAEMELRDVPPLYVGTAARILSFWANKAATGPEIEHGYTLISSGEIVPVQLRVLASPDPYWENIEVACLRLLPEIVLFSCSHGAGHG